jgi:hypothetical protein
MVTMAVFLVLGLAAMKLANQSVGISITQQGQSALNISIRNATAQLQNDAMNAGTGYFPTYNIPGAPLGLVITNDSVGHDRLTILSFDPTIVAHPTASANTATGTMNVTPVSISAGTLAAGYSSGNILMMFSNTVNATTGLPSVTTFPLTAAGSVSGATVNLAFTANVAPVSPNGTWPTTVAGGDPLYISRTYGVGNLGTTFDNTDWVLKTSSIVYYVDPATAQLYRQVNGGTPAAIATNIIGFKLGAMLYNTTDATSYTYGAIADPRQIRSIRVSVIARTTPDATSPFRNAVDGGPYRVEGTSFIINPRNLSLHD